jgi:DNA-binding transcriptional MocR family regulator
MISTSSPSLLFNNSSVPSFACCFSLIDTHHDSKDMADHVMADSRPEPADLSHHLTRNTANRAPSSVKAFYKYFAIPGVVQLAGGLPSDEYFPFDNLRANVARPDRWSSSLGGDDISSRSTTTLKKQKQPDSITVPHTTPQANPLLKIDLASALQYGTAEGYPPLYAFLRTFTQQYLHPNCPYKGGPEVVISCGNTDGFAKVLLALSEEWRVGIDKPEVRQGILCEEFAYMNAVQTATARGLNIVPVGMDEEGLRVKGKGGLRDVLENWDPRKGKQPHLIYLVTVGQNPTSGILSVERRKDLMQVCNEYDIIVVEDEPYYYLQFPTELPDKDAPFLSTLVPSCISFDPQGRVIRLDSFSKTIAPGCRLGWISAQPKLIERLARVTETTTQQPSGFVQSLVAELLVGQAQSESARKSGETKEMPAWSHDGWTRWLAGLRALYQKRMEVQTGVLAKGRELLHLTPSQIEEDKEEMSEWSQIAKTPMFSFSRPAGGMFVWLEMHFETHPLWSKYSSSSQSPSKSPPPHLTGPARLSHALWLFLTTPKYKILVAPGSMFAVQATATKTTALGWKYFRICFASAPTDVLGPATQRLVDGFRDFWAITDWRVVEKLVEDDEAGVDLRNREDGEVEWVDFGRVGGAVC